jgi:L-serine dehydratase
MRAAMRFVDRLGEQARASRLQCELYGSLAATGKGHGTDNALILGFLSESPETVEVAGILELLESVRSSSMHFMALDRRGEVVAEDIVSSLGGGFIASDSEFDQPARGSLPEIPYPCNSGAELLEHCQEGRLSIG